MFLFCVCVCVCVDLCVSLCIQTLAIRALHSEFCWENLKGRDTLGRPRGRLENYVKMDFERGEGPPRTVMPEEGEEEEEEEEGGGGGR